MIFSLTETVKNGGSGAGPGAGGPATPLLRFPPSSPPPRRVTPCPPNLQDREKIKDTNQRLGLCTSTQTACTDHTDCPECDEGVKTF